MKLTQKYQKRFIIIGFVTNYIIEKVNRFWYDEKQCMSKS